MPDGRLGVTGSRTFAGLSPLGWKVIAVDSEETAQGNYAAALAIDGNPDTFWHTRWDADQKRPHAMTVDMGQPHRIAGLAYLPRQDGQLGGTVENFRFETSADGVTWHTTVERGAFGNVRNNPDWQEARFAPATARYFRFTAFDDVWRSGMANAAELTVIPAAAE
jgi:alpha-L-fucosidase